ncbi:MAG: AbrB family transcriptional regulator [Rhodoblastus sp.]|nr:MAG: AbrB family transcriptional regulator [Rhodoblastus sp.]
MPAGWLSGAMAAAAALTAAGRGAQLSPLLRVVALAFAGLALGSSVTPRMLEAFGRYPVSLAVMCVSIGIGIAGSVAFTTRVGGWDKPTALFAAIPGALSYVLALAPGAGADIARVSLAQLVRLFALVALAPALAGAGPARRRFTRPRRGRVDGPLWIASILALGLPLGFLFERLGLSAGVMFGPLIVAALAHGAGLAPGKPPQAVLIVGQVMIGAWSGSRFNAFDFGMLRRAIAPVAGSLAIAAATAACFAWLTSRMVHVSYADAMVAFAPGGLEAMTLLALALGLDPIYVGAHHLARFFLISFTLPVVQRLVLGRGERRRG